MQPYQLQLFNYHMESSSMQIHSPPSSPKLEDIADPTQNPLVCTSTLLSSYYDDNLPCLQTSTQTLPFYHKPDNVVVGFDSSHEVMPSELSTTANSEQALLVHRDHVIHTLLFKYFLFSVVLSSTCISSSICYVNISRKFGLEMRLHSKQTPSYHVQEATILHQYS